jgi:hypothetical protein
MYDGHEGFGYLAEGITRYREKWDVLPVYSQVPERVRNIVMEFVKKCVEDYEFANIWASVQQTAVTSIELTEEECKGVEPYTTLYDEVVRDRRFLNDNIPDSSLVLNGSWSVAIDPNLDNKFEKEVLLELEKRIPMELFPKADGNGHVDEENV